MYGRKLARRRRARRIGEGEEIAGRSAGSRTPSTSRGVRPIALPSRDFAPGQRAAALRHLGATAGNQAVQRLVAQGQGKVIRRGGVVEQPAPGEGGKEYKQYGSKPFTALERIWVEDVMADPLVNLVFSSYGSIPTVIIHRVEELGAAHGDYNVGANELAISDKVYEENPMEEDDPKLDAELQAQHERSFKGTLLHEIFHYIEDNAQALKGQIPLPKQLMGTLVAPEDGNFPPFAFGWFLHPGVNKYLHFQSTGVRTPGSEWNILPYPELEKISRAHEWEPSPMEESGHSINPEEDIAESFAQLLLSEESREAFKKTYPRRSKLLGEFLMRLKTLKAKADTANPEGA